MILSYHYKINCTLREPSPGMIKSNLAKEKSLWKIISKSCKILCKIFSKYCGKYFKILSPVAASMWVAQVPGYSYWRTCFQVCPASKKSGIRWKRPTFWGRIFYLSCLDILWKASRITKVSKTFQGHYLTSSLLVLSRSPRLFGRNQENRGQVLELWWENRFERRLKF